MRLYDSYQTRNDKKNGWVLLRTTDDVVTKLFSRFSLIQHSKTFKQPTKDTFDLLATSSSGDIRACINALQFYCTRGKLIANSHLGC